MIYGSAEHLNRTTAFEFWCHTGDYISSLDIQLLQDEGGKLSKITFGTHKVSHFRSNSQFSSLAKRKVHGDSAKRIWTSDDRASITNRGSLISFFSQSISREKLFLEAKWECIDPYRYFDDERLVKLRESLSVPLYQQTENYLSEYFKQQMETCVNAEEKREQREEIIIN